MTKSFAIPMLRPVQTRYWRCNMDIDLMALSLFAIAVMMTGHFIKIVYNRWIGSY